MCPATPELGVHPARYPSSERPALAMRLALRSLLSLLFAAAVLYIPAGTFSYWQATLYLVIVFMPITLIQVGFLVHDPAIIERRLQTHEVSGMQRHLIRWFRPLFILAALAPGLDHRLGWSRTLLEPVPHWLTFGCDALLVVGILLAGWVIDINAFASRTIRVEAGQPLVSTGPYCLVRHPLYAASLIMWLATPLALGSWIALPVFALQIPFYVLRLINEETLLRAQLPGYTAYCHRTPFRLVPFVW